MRLIDADYLKNTLIRNTPIEDGGIPLKDFSKHQKILALYPTVDAVEVVRCKECKNEAGLNSKKLWCRKFRENVHSNDYCSYGKRNGG